MLGWVGWGHLYQIAPICSTNDHPPLECFLGWQKTLSPRSVAMAHAGKNAGARGVEARGGSAGGQSACVGAGRGGAGGAARQVAGRQAGVSLIFQQSRADARARRCFAADAGRARRGSMAQHCGTSTGGRTPLRYDVRRTSGAWGALCAADTARLRPWRCGAKAGGGAARAARAKARWRATCGTPLALRRTLRAVGGACGLAVCRTRVAYR